jgi:hypothetical protein
VAAQREWNAPLALRADLLGGRHKLVLESNAPLASEALVQLGRASLQWGGALFASEPWRTPDLPTRRDAVAQRLKAAFDPYGLLPAVPEAIA